MVSVADFAHSMAYIGRVNREAFKGEKPEEIARYLAHYNGSVVGGAVGALVAGGKENLPLVMKLMKDTNPWIRAGAVQVYTGLHTPPKLPGKKRSIPEMTPELQQAMDFMEAVRSDPHPEVQRAVGQFFTGLGIENDLVKEILIAQASSPDPKVRGETSEAIRHWIKDPRTRMQVGMEVLKRPEDVSPHAIALAAIYLLEQKDIARPAIPTVVRYINEKAHTIRGFFTNAPYQKGLKLIDYHYDAELEKSHGVVLAVCRSLVRIPYSTYGGWMDARRTAVQILEKMSPAAALLVHGAAVEEQQWLDASTDDEINAVTPCEISDGGRTPRESAAARVKYLHEMGEWLEAGKPAASKPEFIHPAAKKKAAKKKR
jgi:hypothetical protein